jgi:hypothetical protein
MVATRVKMRAARMVQCFLVWLNNSSWLDKGFFRPNKRHNPSAPRPIRNAARKLRFWRCRRGEQHCAAQEL